MSFEEICNNMLTDYLNNLIYETNLTEKEISLIRQTFKYAFTKGALEGLSQSDIITKNDSLIFKIKDQNVNPEMIKLFSKILDSKGISNNLIIPIKDIDVSIESKTNQGDKVEN